jgi:two-component system response regulator TctD
MAPVLVATAEGDLAARVALLHAGADDFLAKPFAIEELEARLIALSRRALGRASGSLDCGPLHYDRATQQFSCSGAALTLTRREHALLLLLMRRMGEPLSKAHILDRLVGEEENLNPESIEVMIYRLRRRLSGQGVRIVTLRGLGYMLEAGDDED